MKCRFALAICTRKKRSFYPRKTQYRPLSEGKIDNYSFYINYFPWPDPKFYNAPFAHKWAVIELGISPTKLARRLVISVAGFGYSVERGKNITKYNDYQLIN